MDGQPLLVVATFRDDEVTAEHPLAGVMGDLATVAGVSRMQLPLFTVAAVAELARAPGVDVDVASLALQYRRQPVLRHGGAGRRGGQHAGHGPRRGARAGRPADRSRSASP